MSETAVVATAVALRGVSKVYRLYGRPIYRALDLFGLCPRGPAYYTEHAALHDVDIAIGRGEKVAVIGRNGAGKSTMLKIVTGLVRPTGGDVEVHGRISNLLQIGSGFHPDFTGRQNVFASLAHQGIVGRAASRLFDEIVDFAEIEEYVDQPMKTYSTGMCSRLMFSSAIVTEPDILVVDEILGVGDAYFAHKSIERMRDLCGRAGTTLLLVTHDISSAMNLCDRFIWIDRGRVSFDGDGRSAISLYESSVKEQEEQWLRQQNAARLAKAGQGDGADRTLIHVLVRSRTGFAMRRPLPLGEVELVLDDGTRTTLRVAAGAREWELLPESNLGGRETVDGEPARALRPTGSIYHKAEWVVAIPSARGIAGGRVRWRYDGDDSAEFRVFGADRRTLLAGELGATRGWSEATFDRATGVVQELSAQKAIDFGTGRVRITALQFLDAEGREIVRAIHGAPLLVRVRLQISPDLDERRVTFIVGFSRQGSAYLGVVHQPALLLPRCECAVIDVRLDPLRLGNGQWYVNVGVGLPNIYESGDLKYFAVDDSWHHLLSGRLELQVTSPGGVEDVGCFVVHPAVISCS